MAKKLNAKQKNTQRRISKRNDNIVRQVNKNLGKQDRAARRAKNK